MNIDEYEVEYVNEHGTLVRASIVDGNLHIEKVKEVGRLLDHNQFSSENLNMKSDFRHVASIDTVTSENLRNTGVMDDPNDFARWLNDADNDKFRVWRGRLNGKDLGG